MAAALLKAQNGQQGGFNGHQANRLGAGGGAAGGGGGGGGGRALLHDLEDVLGYSDEEMEEDVGFRVGAAAGGGAAGRGGRAGDDDVAFAGRGRALGGGLGAAAGRAGGNRLSGMAEDMDLDMGMDGFDSEGDGAGMGMLNRAGGRLGAAAAVAVGGGGVPRRRGRPSAASTTAGGGTGGIGSAQDEVLRGLLPRVPAAKRPEPMCGEGDGCEQCASLRRFLGNARALELPMVLNKKQQKHVQKVVAWLVAPEGGRYELQCGEPVGEEGRWRGEGLCGLDSRRGSGRREL